MKRIPKTLAITFVAVGLSIAAAAQVRGTACSYARAAGTYGVSASGTIIGVGPRVSVGTVTLDRAGNVTGKATSSLNGAITHEDFPGHTP